MGYNEMQALASKHELGTIDWESKIARNTGKLLDVGYVFVDGHRELFCKRGYSQEHFRLCNQFSELV